MRGPTQINPFGRSTGVRADDQVTDHNGGYARGCRWLLERALRSASDVDVQAHVGTATVRPYAWRVKGWDPRSSQPNLTGWRSVGGPTYLIAA